MTNRPDIFRKILKHDRQTVRTFMHNMGYGAVLAKLHTNDLRKLLKFLNRRERQRRQADEFFRRRHSTSEPPVSILDQAERLAIEGLTPTAKKALNVQAWE